MAKLTIEIDNIAPKVLDELWQNVQAYGVERGDIIKRTDHIRINAVDRALIHPVTLNKIIDIITYAISFHCVQSPNVKDN